MPRELTQKRTAAPRWALLCNGCNPTAGPLRSACLFRHYGFPAATVFFFRIPRQADEPRPGEENGNTVAPGTVHAVDCRPLIVTVVDWLTTVTATRRCRWPSRISLGREAVKSLYATSCAIRIERWLGAAGTAFLQTCQAASIGSGTPSPVECGGKAGMVTD